MTRRRIDHRLDRLAQRLDQAARIKPSVDEHIATQLAYCDTAQMSEAGAVHTSTLNDPVIRQVVAREGWVTKSNRIEDALVRIGAAVDSLDEALRAAHAPRVDTRSESRCPKPTLKGDVMQQCGKLSGHYVRPHDGTLAIREDLLCDEHGLEADRAEQRRKESDARRARRHAS